MNDTMKITGTIRIKVTGPDGTIIVDDTMRNAITLIGYSNLNDFITGNGTPAALTHLGIGWGAGANDVFADTQTDLQGANQDRVIATVTQIDQKNFKLVATWNQTEPTAPVGGFPVPIDEIGIFWGTTPDKMFARAIRSTTLYKENADTLQITYTITFS